jgi:hypothetical protein
MELVEVLESSERGGLERRVVRQVGGAAGGLERGAIARSAVALSTRWFSRAVRAAWNAGLFVRSAARRAAWNAGLFAGSNAAEKPGERAPAEYSASFSCSSRSAVMYLAP